MILKYKKFKLMMNQVKIKLTNLAHEVGQPKTHHHCGKTTSNKSFPSFLWAELDQWGSAHEKAKDIGHDIIDNDHHDRHDEPDEALEHVLDDEV